MCTQERMQELAREQERLQEERRVGEQKRREVLPVRERLLMWLMTTRLRRCLSCILTRTGILRGTGGCGSGDRDRSRSKRRGERRWRGNRLKIPPAPGCVAS